MKRCAACLSLLMLFAAGGLAAEPPKGTGPWDVERILDTTTPFWLDAESENLKSIRYPSEPYRGKETEVFAYYAVPKGRGPFPAMLLVHGGGGKAFEEWARLWADRGYVALAMDLAGCGPDGQRMPKGGPPMALTLVVLGVLCGFFWGPAS